MSALAIVIIAVAGVLILLFLAGLLAARRRFEATEHELDARIAAADRALEAARAADRGWDPVLLEEAAREGLARERPDFHYDKLHLVLVDDRPGTEHDRAEMAAVGHGHVVRVAVVRHGETWTAEAVR